MNRNIALGIGFAATLGATILWHGPGGAGERFRLSLDHDVRQMLDNYEMQAVTANLERDPLTRRIMLNGPADDFQRAEIKRMTESMPGVASAQWGQSRAEGRQLPLFVEVTIIALACFAAGLVVAYISTLRQRTRRALRS